MKLLVDTHTLLWYHSGDKRLSERARRTLDNHDSTRVLSAATIWELSIKSSRGRLELPSAPEQYVETKIAQGYEVWPITWLHAVAVARLPWHHRDPFDRMLIAQALEHGLTIVTVDDCKDVEVCNTRAVVEEIRRNVTYGLVMREVAESSEEGQKLISDLSVKYLPAYLFSRDLAGVPTFADLQTKSDIPYFTDLGDYYVLNYAARTEPAKYMANNFEYFPEELEAETAAGSEEVDGESVEEGGAKTEAEVTPKDDDAVKDL